MQGRPRSNVGLCSLIAIEVLLAYSVISTCMGLAGKHKGFSQVDVDPWGSVTFGWEGLCIMGDGQGYQESKCNDYDNWPDKIVDAGLVVVVGCSLVLAGSVLAFLVTLFVRFSPHHHTTTIWIVILVLINWILITLTWTIYLGLSVPVINDYIKSVENTAVYYSVESGRGSTFYLIAFDSLALLIIVPLIFVVYKKSSVAPYVYHTINGT
eukprot:TRINITY_DN5450_c0_g1_i1.p1 TRINITY_DN5450_c0_g1~~TRINITY_DN5450_c0_g1_i1.p1  ORF type:complete len:210 (-),score=7.43 TRINITY_DN5450_c0_g1_i1:71-700(-)